MMVAHTKQCVEVEVVSDIIVVMTVLFGYSMP